MQIFFLVVVFALYNGLVLLPIVLSFLGPGAKARSHNRLFNEDKMADNCANNASKELSNNVAGTNEVAFLAKA